MSLIHEFFGDLVQYLLRDTVNEPIKYENIVKQHTEKLKQNGDVGFFTLPQAWSRLCNGNLTGKIIDENDFKAQKQLIEASQKWIFPISRIAGTDDRCILFLNREKCFRQIFMQIFNGNFIGRNEFNDGHFRPFDVDLLLHLNDGGLTEFRCIATQKVLINLLLRLVSANQSDFEFNGKNRIDVIITHSRTRNEKERRNANRSLINNERLKIVCGEVRSKRIISADEFIRTRAIEMEEVSKEKTEAVSYDCNKFGADIVKFELLQTRYANIISLEQLVQSAAPQKGAVFILYNVARLEKILDQFNERVQGGQYDRLPAIDDVDFSLLKDEEEWKMAYIFLDGYSNVLQKCLHGIEKGNIAIHLLCTYLVNLSSLFSIYYHRVRILTENRSEMMQTIHARIYLLKAIRSVYHDALAVLDIEPLKRM